MRFMIFTAAAFAVATPAVSPAQTLPATATPIEAAGKKKTELVCQSVVATGTRLGKRRVCRTAGEWSEINAADRRDIERMQANRYKGND